MESFERECARLLNFTANVECENLAGCVLFKKFLAWDMTLVSMVQGDTSTGYATGRMDIEAAKQPCWRVSRAQTIAPIGLK